jgi:ABC-type branched-subunit amino acid transport system ATPase component
VRYQTHVGNAGLADVVQLSASPLPPQWTEVDLAQLQCPQNQDRPQTASLLSTEATTTTNTDSPRLSLAECWHYFRDIARTTFWLAPRAMHRANWRCATSSLALSASEGAVAWAVWWSTARLFELGSSTLTNEALMQAGTLIGGLCFLQKCRRDLVDWTNQSLSIAMRRTHLQDLITGVTNQGKNQDDKVKETEGRFIDNSQAQIWVPSGLSRYLSDLIGSISTFSVMTLSIAFQAPLAVRIAVGVMIVPKVVALIVNTSRYEKDTVKYWPAAASMRAIGEIIFSRDYSGDSLISGFYNSLQRRFWDSRQQIDRAEQERSNEMAMYNLVANGVYGLGIFLTFRTLILDGAGSIPDVIYLFGIVNQLYISGDSLAERFALVKKAGVYLKEWMNFVDIASTGTSLDLSNTPVGVQLQGVVLVDQNTAAPISTVPDVSIQSGAILVVLGDSGSGKTALMRTLAGQPGGIAQGRFAINLGTETLSKDEYSRASITGGIGFYHQNHPKIAALQVQELLNLKEWTSGFQELCGIFKEFYGSDSVAKIKENLSEPFGNGNFSDQEQEMLFLLAALIRGSGLVLIDGLSDVIDKPRKLVMIVKARDALFRQRERKPLPTLIISARLEEGSSVPQEVEGHTCTSVRLSAMPDAST